MPENVHIVNVNISGNDDCLRESYFIARKTVSKCHAEKRHSKIGQIWYMEWNAYRR